MTKPLQTAVIGVTGYAGAELARLLLHHPRLKGVAPIFVGRVDEADAKRGGIPLGEIHPELNDSLGSGQLKQQPFSWELLEQNKVDVLFLATPHEASREWVPEALKRGIKIIDLSGAWRLVNPANRAIYAFKDDGSPESEQIQSQAVYGSPELHRAEIKNAKLVANPGCYATSVILPLRPLVEYGLLNLDCGIIADAKSGVSGAGKGATAKTHYMACVDNLSAYGVFNHRHTGELLEQIGLEKSQIIFTPHLLPIPRGIMSTIYVTFKTAQTKQSVSEAYHKFFAHSPMVRLFDGNLPQIAYSVRTNYCDIGFQLSPCGKKAVIVSCLDNLLKGASGQAVQNLNVMMGWPEAEGLE